ncbi:MAG: S41 family peptidase [Candidatus Nanogingivalaceae bacterium]|nr:S41 family peptidase [Candidatus Nanogingivalaceae bacterium]
MANEQGTGTMAQKRLPRRVSQGVFLASLALVAVISFVAGMRSDELYHIVAPIFGVKVAKQPLNTEIMNEVYRELVANYDGDLDVDKLSDGAARGMTKAVGDDYTSFMDKKEAAEFNKDLNGEISGIGAEIGMRGLQPTVLRVIDDSPAKKAGLKAGDVFVAVNGMSVAGETAGDVADKVTGEAGTTVKLTVRRSGESLDFSITRAQINDPSVRWSVSDNVGILTISRFDENTGSLARKAASEFTNKGVKGVIVDLRNNGGGYLTAAQEVASLWLDDGKMVVTEKSRGKVTDTIKASGSPTFKGKKTIVLVNGNSASASEIVAGALKDYQVATLVGEKTFGKGTVQKVINLSDGRILKVTVARWYTPHDRNITKEGIQPNQTVKMSSDDTNAGRDPQMARAKELAT